MQPKRILIVAMTSIGIAFGATAETQLNMVSDGTGPTMLFVHGSISDLRVWEPIRAEIPNDIRTVAYDMRYFGEADWPDEGESFSIDTHVDDLIAMIETLEVPAVDLVTWSYSGEIGVKAALKRPELFRSMIHYEPVIASLLDGVEGADEATKDLLSRFGTAIGAMKEGDTETAALRFVEVVFKWPEGEAELAPEASLKMWRLNGRTLPIQLLAPPGEQVSCDDLSGLEVPTLVIAGSDTYDRYMLMAKRLSECLPTATFRILEGFGHDGPYSAPKEVSTILLDFASQ